MASIPVRIEPPKENTVLEITYDGQEITQPPLSMSENLAKQARKIDFSQETEMMEVDEPEDTDDEMKSFSQPVWPWESVRNKLQDTLTELCVASDVLTIATKECGKDPGGNPKRYMVLDGPVQADTVDQKPFVQLLAMKKALEVPSKILIQGAEHLKNLQNETKGVRSPEDFHIELLRLRQNWRLKKVGNSILGDLSYRTAGSQFKQSGVFEVTKADDTLETSSAGPGGGGGNSGSTGVGGGLASQSASSNTSTPAKFPSALKVSVPSELEGIAYIQVMIQRDNEQLVSATLGQFTGLAQNCTSMHWKNKLEAAQNVLFCKELFSQLAREAVELQGPIPHMVVGSQIIASVFPDIQLTISLCHSPAASDSRKGGSGSGAGSAPAPSRNDHSDVLEHSLFQLLRKVQANNINPDGPSLSSAPIGIPRKRRAAGPEAADRHALVEMAGTETLLEQIVRQAQHVVLRLRTIFVLDTLAREFKDPLITSHWSTLSSPTCSSVKVSIVSAGYDIIIKTQLVIHVGEKMQRVICKDGRVLNFSYEPQELRDFILCQLAHHQISGVQYLAKVMGWQVLSSSSFLGSGPVEPIGSAAGCLLANASGNRFLAVRHSPQSNYSVYMAQGHTDDVIGSVVTDAKWENLPSSFKQVKLDKMDGKNLLAKVELLMAALSSPSSSTQQI